MVDNVIDGILSTEEFNRAKSTSLLTIQSIQTPINEWTLEQVMHVAFYTLDEAHEFLNSYASVVGFSLRKDRVYKRGDIVTMRRYVCSKEGIREEKYMLMEGSSRRSRHVTRCGCDASFKIKLLDDSLFHIIEFNSVHNHGIVLPLYSQIVRSNRNIDDATAHQVSELTAAGIKPSQIMNVLVSTRCGYQYVRFTRVDLYNHVYRSSDCRSVDDDCDRALFYIQSLVQQDPGIVCRFHTDSDVRLDRLFFSNTISKNDYRLFEDVVISDSTYKTNHYRMPLVLLLGVDNHFSMIVFACALISDEEGENYK